jgi:hypothetical protein
MKFADNTGYYASNAAVLVGGWQLAGGGQFAVGVTPGQGTIVPHISYGWGTGGTYVWGHGLGEGLYTTTAFAGPGTLFNVTGIPILSPATVGGWVATEPAVGNCLGSAITAFGYGWGTYIIP